MRRWRRTLIDALRALFEAPGTPINHQRVPCPAGQHCFIGRDCLHCDAKAEPRAHTHD